MSTFTDYDHVLGATPILLHSQTRLKNNRGCIQVVCMALFIEPQVEQLPMYSI